MSAAAPISKRFTREEVDRMTELGLFEGQRLELIDGDLIDKMGQSASHADVIQLICDSLFQIFGLRRIRVQAPLEVTAADQKHNFPEPDLSVRSDPKFTPGKRHPRGDETLLVVEVADTSLRIDLTNKRDLNARAGVPEYWVLNLKSRKLVVHRNLKKGAYATTTTLTSRESVTIGGQSIRVADMLP